MYRGGTDNECPRNRYLNPSCGDSRFGCWVCTMVSQDKSMEAMIQNDEEKEWMQPLLDIRNDLMKTIVIAEIARWCPTFRAQCGWRNFR